MAKVTGSSPMPNESRLVFKWRTIEDWAHHSRVSKVVVGLKEIKKKILKSHRKRITLSVKFRVMKGGFFPL